MKHRQSILKWLILFGLGLILVVLARYVEPDKILTPILQWIESLGTFGAIAFIIIYIIATAIFVPGSILALAGGALFGKILGTVLVFCGGFLGSYTAFSLGRYFLRDWVKKKIANNNYLKALNKVIAAEGWKIACLLHLSPVIPFNMLNYALGASKISQKNFIIATSIGIFPGVLLYTFLGSTIGDLTMVVAGMSSEADNKIQWFFSGIGIVATIGITVYLTRMARQQIENKLQQ